MLQAMTSPENCAQEALDNPNSVPHPQQWPDANPSPVPFFAPPPPDYWGYYPPQNMEGQYWDPYSYMAYMNEMNAAYGYPPVPYPPVYSPQHFGPPMYPRYHPNGSDSDEYSGYSSTDEMAYYGANFQRNAMMHAAAYQRPGVVSRIKTETPRIVVTPTNQGGETEDDEPKSKSNTPNGRVSSAARNIVEELKRKAAEAVKKREQEEELAAKKGAETKAVANGMTNGDVNTESEEDSDTEVEDDDEDEDDDEEMEKEKDGIKAIKSVSDINVYNSDEGVLESNDEDTEQEETEEEEEDEEEEEEEDEEEEEENEELPHQLSVIYEESELSDAESVRRGAKSVTSEDESSTATLDVESDDEVDEGGASSSVTVRLPLKLRFSRSANDEEVTTVIVGDSQVDNSLAGLKPVEKPAEKPVEKPAAKKEVASQPPKTDQCSKIQGRALQQLESLLKETEEELGEDSDISVTFSIPSRKSPTGKPERPPRDGKPPAPETPAPKRETPPSPTLGVSRQQSADDLDSYATCEESDSDVSVCLSLKMRKPSPKPDERTDDSHSHSSSASVATVRSAHAKSADSGSDMESNDDTEPSKQGFWDTEQPKTCEFESRRIGNKIDEIINATNKIIGNRPTLEIGIHFTKSRPEPEIQEKEEPKPPNKPRREEYEDESEESESSEDEDEEEEEEDEVEDKSESSCVSNESATSCVAKKGVSEEKNKVVPSLEQKKTSSPEVAKEVEVKVVEKPPPKGDTTDEEGKESESDGYGYEEEQFISKIYDLVVQNGVEEKGEIKKSESNCSETNGKAKKKGEKEKGMSRNNSESGGEEDDSGVTSDMSRHISDTESDAGGERNKTQYQRASTHSRLFRLLRDACERGEDDDDDDDGGENGDVATPAPTIASRRELLTLPLRANTLSDPDSHSSSSGVTSPASPTVTDRLVKELVQSLLQRKKGKRLKKLPMAKLHAAALRILQEDMDPYDTGSSAGSEDCPSPARHPPAPPQHSMSHAPVQTPYGAHYYDYCDYYNSWANAAAYYGEEPAYDIVPSRAFRLLSEHAAQPTGFAPGIINGLWAKCPRLQSGMMKHQDSVETNPSSSSEPNSPLPPHPYPHLHPRAT